MKNWTYFYVSFKINPLFTYLMFFWMNIYWDLSKDGYNFDYYNLALKENIHWETFLMQMLQYFCKFTNFKISFSFNLLQLRQNNKLEINFFYSSLLLFMLVTMWWTRDSKASVFQFSNSSICSFIEIIFSIFMLFWQ